MGYIPGVEAQLDNALGTVENLRKRCAELETALRDLLMVIEVDQLIPESVSYMRQARAALQKSGKL